MRKTADELRSERWIAAQDVRGFSHRARFMQMGCDLESVRNRPVIGVLNTWNGISPGHAELRRNAERVRQADLVGDYDFLEGAWARPEPGIY